MRITGIYGSIRPKGNTDWMLSTLLDSSETEGADVNKIFLRDFKHIEWCTGCDCCHTNGGTCIIKDDMQEIYPKLIKSDIIILGCPNYFKGVSALTKNFMDRTNAFVRVKPCKLLNKYAIGMCVGGEELEDTQHCIDQLARFFKGHKMKTLCMLKARADKPGEISNDIELERILVDIGNKLAKNELDIVSGMPSIRTEKHSMSFFDIANSMEPNGTLMT
ncbi:flavodoxin family protein [Candidatus Bathyarchaeota archaeon]|nr:flavodoxin family protein [Candidatus Bathyarchaeota archaeon]